MLAFSYAIICFQKITLLAVCFGLFTMTTSS